MKATALITGATGGLGRSVAECFVADDWRVVAPVRSRGDSAIDEHPRLETVEADVTDPVAVQRAVRSATADDAAPLRAVVNLVGGSAGGSRVHETPIGYIASKAAVIAFAQAVAIEYGDAGIRCNAVLPSVIDTSANRRAQPEADHTRWVWPERIAAVIRFLCDETSSSISGAAIPVYGRA